MKRLANGQVERVAELQAGAPVWQLAFNDLGIWLAASTIAGRVQLLRPGLDGTWQLLSEVRGAETAEAPRAGA